MKFDHYSIVARIFPAVLSSIPFFVLDFYYLGPTLGQFWEQLLAIQIVSDVTISLAFLYLLVQASRYISKGLFQSKMFNDNLSFPTTNYLLHLDSHYSPEYTAKIHAKIRADFKIKIPSREQELNDTERSRKLIAEAVGQIRARVKDGHLTAQHNAEYGFSRNLAGGAIIAFFISLIDGLLFGRLFYNTTALWISGIMAILYLLIILFSRKIISAFANDYAKKLIEEYMSG